MRRQPSEKFNLNRSRSGYVALGVAAATVPRSFQKSLLPRNTVDQGIATGMIMAIVYGLGTIIQDGLDSVTNAYVESTVDRDGIYDRDEIDKIYKVSSAATSLGALGLGVLAYKLIAQKPGEKYARSATRVGGMWLAYAGAAGLIVQIFENIFNEDNDPTNGTEKKFMIPAIVTTGTTIAFVGEYLRRKNDPYNQNKKYGRKDILESLAIGGGTAVALTGIAYTERKMAQITTKTIHKYAPALDKTARPLGHATAFAILGGVVYLALNKVYKDIEHGSKQLEPAVKDAPLSPLISGSKSSKVSWESLTKEPRRHVASYVQTSDIKQIMGSKVADPIRVYVGVDSAPSRYDRVNLALAELRRTKAFDREIICVFSPTGTGYINYIFTESLEYMTKGNVATVGMQYSKRPSPMSLDHVSDGHIQYRMLLNGIKRELANRPVANRPRIVLFGESLGAWTSQDAFLHEGTDGFESVGIDSALWIGTPAGSKWHEEVVGPKASENLNVNHEQVGKFATYEELMAVPLAKRNKIRYYFLTNHNDPIAYFGVNLLLKKPDWLGDKSTRNRALPTNANWRTPATFIHAMLDMKNALTPEPGNFVANGHDYRETLARFVKQAYRLKVTPKQMENIEAALRRNEIQRSEDIKNGVALQTEYNAS